MIEIGVIVGLASGSNDPESIGIKVLAFARLEDGRRVMAHPGPDVPRIILGQRGVAGLCGPASEDIRFAPSLIIESTAISLVLEAFGTALGELG